MSKGSKKPTIEENFACLDEVLEKMEDPDISLEDTFALYERGMKILKSVTDAVDEVEKKVKLIDDEGNTEDFE